VFPTLFLAGHDKNFRDKKKDDEKKNGELPFSSSSQVPFLDTWQVIISIRFFFTCSIRIIISF